MREFDESYLTEVQKLSAKDVIAPREREAASQVVLARHLNEQSSSLARRNLAELGEKRPSGPSLKLLALIKAKGLDAIA